MFIKGLFVLETKEFHSLELIPWTNLFGSKVGEEAIDIIKKNISDLKNWKNIEELIPKRFSESKKLKKSGLAGFFAGSLELTREGVIQIMQKKNFDKILIKEKI